jgi:hypothetical protein
VSSKVPPTPPCLRPPAVLRWRWRRDTPRACCKDLPYHRSPTSVRRPEDRIHCDSARLAPHRTARTRIGCRENCLPLAMTTAATTTHSATVKTRNQVKKGTPVIAGRSMGVVLTMRLACKSAPRALRLMSAVLVGHAPSFRCRKVLTQAAAGPAGCQAARASRPGCSSPDSRQSARSYRACQPTLPERGTSGPSQERPGPRDHSSRS